MERERKGGRDAGRERERERREGGIVRERDREREGGKKKVDSI